VQRARATCAVLGHSTSTPRPGLASVDATRLTLTLAFFFFFFFLLFPFQLVCAQVLELASLLSLSPSPAEPSLQTCSEQVQQL
jgi:hypothetical protein